MLANNANPIVSAVIRTHNRAHLVSRAIESVLAQTLEDFELIVMDDCSTDNTSEIVEGYAERDHRIQYIRQTTHVSNVKALNMATDLAKGKYVAYLDDDDTWRPRKLELQLNRFTITNEDVGLVTGGIQYWNLDTGEKLHTVFPSLRGNIYWETLGSSGHIFGPPSVVMIKKDIFDDVGWFREDMPRGACQQLFRRISQKYVIDFVEGIVLDYYFHKNTITSITTPEDVTKSIKSMLVKIESTRDDLEQVPEVYSGELVKLAKYYHLDGQHRKAWETFKMAAEIKDVSPYRIMGRYVMSVMKRRIALQLKGT